MSGDVSCSSNVCSQPGLCYGIIVGFTIEDSEAFCLSTCIANPLCAWYSFDATTNYCQMTEDCDTIEECTIDDCSHGERFCGDRK